jgi:hypothetical protein
MDGRFVVKTILFVITAVLFMSTVTAYRSDPTLWTNLNPGQLNDFVISSAFCFLNIYSLSNLVHFKLASPVP